MAPKKASERKRQSKLNFSPAPPLKGPPSPENMGQSSSANQLPSRRSKRARVYSSSEDELQAETERSMRLSSPVKITPSGMFDGSDLDRASSESEEEQLDTTVPTPKRRRRNHSHDSDDDDLAPRTVPRTRHGASRIDVESMDDEETLRLPSRRRKTRRQRTQKEDARESTPPRSTKRRSSRRHPPSDEEELEEADENNQDDEEQDDLREDLAFLKSSPLADRGRLRSTQDKPKNERQKALEALKRRRASNNAPSSSATPVRRRTVVLESGSESELEIVKEESSADSDSSDQDEIEDDEEDDEDDIRSANAFEMFRENQDDEEFIDDDVDPLIGEPSAIADLDELNLLNHLTRAKPKELFKNAVEWMVMKKIHPAFDSNQTIYQVTFRKLDDEVKGLADSKFTSSVWTPDFTRSIQARPNLDIDEISLAMRDVVAPHCEACNRSNHVAAFQLMLTGLPYDAETLEPLETGDSSSDNDSEVSVDPATRPAVEKKVYDAQGELLPPEDHRFALGSTCKANAQVAHTLHHWRYHLYQWVNDYLERNGHLSAQNLVKRAKWTDRKRKNAAQKIVDVMEQEGEVRGLYRLYRDQVEFAVGAKNEYRDGWGRRR